MFTAQYELGLYTKHITLFKTVEWEAGLSYVLNIQVVTFINQPFTSLTIKTGV
jgi:hypothetical protein